MFPEKIFSIDWYWCRSIFGIHFCATRVQKILSSFLYWYLFIYLFQADQSGTVVDILVEDGKPVSLDTVNRSPFPSPPSLALICKFMSESYKQNLMIQCYMSISVALDLIFPLSMISMHISVLGYTVDTWSSNIKSHRPAITLSHNFFYPLQPLFIIEPWGTGFVSHEEQPPLKLWKYDTISLPSWKIQCEIRTISYLL